MSSHHNERTIVGVQDNIGEEGFSLVELLVVLTIMALLAGIVTTTVVGYLDGARVSTAKTQMKTLAAAVNLYKIDLGRYPTEHIGLEGLVVNAGNSDKWRGPYIAGKTVPADPWDSPYQYKLIDGGKTFDIVSFGSDGVTGGEDDAADIALE